jgi:alpha-glucosidase
MTTLHGRVVVAALLLAACSSPRERAGCPVDADLPERWSIAADGIVVEVERAPYRVIVKRRDGSAVLESLGAGGGDGYAALGWTSGRVDYQPNFAPGYTQVETVLDAWRDGFEVAEVSAAPDELRVELAATGDRGAGCVSVVHRVSPSALRVEAGTTDAAPRAWATAFRAPADEGFLGLGERFNRTDQRGVDVYAWAEEGGLGNGEGTAPSSANPFPSGEAMTYYPVPFFVSTRGYGFWLDTTWRSEMNLATARGDAWRAWHVGPSLAYEVYLPRPGDPRPWPYHLIDAFTARTGRPMRPPAWAFGPRRRFNRFSMADGQSELAAMRERDLAITSVDDAAHFFPAGSHLGGEDELRAWTAAAAALGYRVNGYYNSMLATRADSPLAAVTAAARAAGYLLTNPDGSLPDVWVLTGGRVEALGVVDFTDPAATAWYQSTFAWAKDLGYSGWMYDFGEYVQPSVVAADGRSGEELHNLYPVLYARAAHDALRGEQFTFMRSGYTGSSAFAPMVWSGDPAASFESSDGLPSMPRAAINLGVSGAPHWAGDIGGYHCLADGPAAADEELLVRWIQQGSMTSGMQDQDACEAGGGASKATIWTAPAAMSAWRTYARLHTRLLPYLESLAVIASATGAPVVRHLFLEHPERIDLRAVDDAYYLGPALLVAPVVVRGAREKVVALPDALYLDWHTRALIAGDRVATLPAPLDTLPLLLRAGHLVPLLDPAIDTLAAEDHRDVIGPADVADVLDVVGLLAPSAPSAAIDLADGARFTAALAGDGTAPTGFAEVDAAALATCTACWRSDDLAAGRRIRISAEPGQSVVAGGLTLTATTDRRVRWDLVIAP